jgi:outer membrane immunogenic protein
MTKTLLATTMLTGLLISGVAQAADMPLKAPPREAPYYTDWTGFYLFGFGGYSWGKISADSGGTALKPKGGVFGFGGGYLWQYGAWVGGLEVDYGFSDEKENRRFRVNLCDDVEVSSRLSCTGSINVHSKIDALGSARVRAGYLFTPNVLAYGTAGVAWGRSEVNVADVLIAKPNLFGWVAGGGLEYKLFQHVRIRGEYLHYDFGSTTYAFQTPFIIGVNANFKTRDDVARGALIWSFN